MGDVEHGAEFLEGIEVGFRVRFLAEEGDAAGGILLEEADLNEVGAEGAEALEADIFGCGGLGRDGEHPAEGVGFVDVGGFGETVEGEEGIEFAVDVDEGFVVDGITEAATEGEEAFEEGGEAWAVEIEGDGRFRHGGHPSFMPGGRGRSTA